MIRRRIAQHPVAADVVLALTAGAVAFISGTAKIDTWVVVLPAPWPWYALWAVSYASLLLRRRAPVVVTAVALVCLVAQNALDTVSLPWALLIGLYSVAVQRGARWAWVCSAAVVGSLALAGTVVPSVEAPLVAAFGIVVVVLAGLNVRSRRQYLAALIDRAAQLERDRDQEARLAAGAERARIARELHDVVAHGMSVMISLSDGADAVAEVDPARSRDAVRQIGVVGREALADMRRLLGVLHDDDDDDAALAPQPGLDGLDDLVETYRTAGLPVALTRVGELPTAPALQVVLYRTVQEGLTNSLRYAEGPTRVAVVLRGAEGRGAGAGSGRGRGSGGSGSGGSGSSSVDALGLGLGGVTVEVVDDGAGTAPAASVGTERGLVGLRERAALYGGTLEAGPRPELGGRGWRLRLALPGPGGATGAQPSPGASAQPLPEPHARPAARATTTSTPTPTSTSTSADADQLPEEAP